MARRTRKRKNHSKKLPRWQQIIIAVIVVICCVMAVNEHMTEPLLPTWDEMLSKVGLDGAETVVPDGEMQITVIDVGNADSILVQSDGQAMLIDAGERGDGDEVLAALAQNGVTALNHVIATHADSDHIGGMKTVLEGVAVKNYIMSFMPEGYTPTTQTYINVLETIDAKDIPLTEAQAGTSFMLGEAKVEILGPAADFKENNDQSVICRITFGENAFLFMGDAEEDAEQALLSTRVDLSADVLKVGHHGSDTSTGEELLERVDPSVALITCGTGNSYGHPHEDLLRRLQDAGAQIYRSDVNGTITLHADGRTFTVDAEKGEAAR